ncbi:MAG: hypothetical protein J6B87_06920 [Clostridia bacterium]|nr:hypothetical protein [Clostridia bacterium]
MSEKKNEQFDVETLLKDMRDYKPVERERYPIWNTGAPKSFMPDLESGCIFSPEYAEIQRKLQKKDSQK